MAVDDISGRAFLILFFGILLVLLVCFIIISSISVGIGFFREVKYINMEINRSCSVSEYEYWKKRKIVLILTLIPGVDTKKAKNIVRHFERKRK